MEREIIVLGRGSSRGLPDRAVVRVTIDADGPSQSEAYAAASTAATAVDTALDAESTAVDRIVTSSLFVQPLTRWKRGESIRTGWRASRTSTVEVTGLDRLGPLLSGIAAAGGALSSLDWQLDPEHPARVEARAAAAADARHRAADYAAALGVTAGDVAWVAEPGLRLGGSGMGGPYAGAMRAMVGGAGPADGEGIQIEIEEITVDAEVEVGFTITGAAGEPS